MFSGDSAELETVQQSTLDAILTEAADRVESLGNFPLRSLATVIDNAVWEVLVFRMASDPRVVAELVAGFHLDTRTKVPMSAVLNGLRRSELLISPIRELSIAMSVASFLSQSNEWVRAELRERGYANSDPPFLA